MYKPTYLVVLQDKINIISFQEIWTDYVRVYGGLRFGHSMFTWYGHKILVYTVLTVAVSDLHYSTLHLQRQCLI